MEFPSALRFSFIAGLACLLSLAPPAAAQWAGFNDQSAALGTNTFSFVGANAAAGDTNENYYDGDMGDFDGDGWMDRALIARYGLLFNTGGGFMTPVANTITGGTYRFGDKDGVGNDATQWADVDNDGDLDIIQGGNGETLTLQMNSSAGRFTTKPIPSVSALQIINTDLEKDGDVDLVIAHAFCSDIQCGHGCPEGGCQGVGNWPKQFNIFRNDGSGTFTNVTVVAGFPGNWGEKLIVGLVSGDVDNDGDFDIMMVNGIDRGITLARNNGTGVFVRTLVPFAVAMAAIRPITSGFSQGMNLGDIDGDGDLDLVCALARDTAGSPHPRVAHAVFINDGAGNFIEETATRFTVAGTSFYAGGNGKLMDADYDNDLDFFAFDGETRHFQVYLNEGTGRFTYNAAQSRTFAGGSSASGTGADNDVTDLNRDGAYDVWIGAAGQDPRTLVNTFQSADGQPANLPRNLLVTAANTSGVTLAWQHPPYADVARWYKVYRATAPGLAPADRRLIKRVARSRHQDEGFAAPLTQFTTTAALNDPDVVLAGSNNEVQFIDRTGAPGVTYFYSVSHVGTENIESVPAAEVAAAAPPIASADTTPPTLDILSPAMQDWSPYARIVLHYGDGGSGINTGSLRVSFNRALGNAAADGRAAGSDISDLFFRKDTSAYIAALSGSLALPQNQLATLTAMIADNAGNVQTKTVQFFVSVPVPAPPTAALTTSTTGLGALTTDFSGTNSTAAPTKIVRWEWYFGDGTTAFGRTVRKDFAAGGTFPVTLLVRDLRGGVATASRTVAVADLAFLSTAFEGGRFAGTFPSAADRTYVIDSSNSLEPASWAEIARFPGTGSTLSFTDPAAVSSSRKFFRLRLGP
ncbi:MAG: FG-GAP-like repeat-containing protein [Verrucomicrobiales bacterium]